MTITPGETLSGECRALERDYPGWAAHPSEDGWIWAQDPGGPWLHEPTALRMRETIARREREQHRAPVIADVVPLLLAAPCPHHGCTHDRGSHLDGTGPCGWCACPSFAGEQIPFAALDDAAARQVRHVA